MIRNPFKKRIAQDESGATLIEFAFVAPTFMLMLMGLFDLGYGVYMQSALTGAVQNAARSAALETGPNKLAAIDLEVKNHILALNANATVPDPVRKSYFDYNDVSQPEVFDDTSGDGIRDAGECFEDVNGNDTWDADIGEDGVGGPNDIVLYTVTVSYDRMFPFWHMMGWDQEKTITSSTVLKNQPYGDQSSLVVTTVCT